MGFLRINVVCSVGFLLLKRLVRGSGYCFGLLDLVTSIAVLSLYFGYLRGRKGMQCACAASNARFDYIFDYHFLREKQSLRVLQKTSLYDYHPPP